MRRPRFLSFLCSEHSHAAIVVFKEIICVQFSTAVKRENILPGGVFLLFLDILICRCYNNQQIMEECNYDVLCFQQNESAASHCQIRQLA